MNAGTRVTVAGLPGTWTVLGPATYADEDGRTVEHDWVRVAVPGDERWVAPGDLSPVAGARVAGAA